MECRVLDEVEVEKRGGEMNGSEVQGQSGREVRFFCGLPAYLRLARKAFDTS